MLSRHIVDTGSHLLGVNGRRILTPLVVGLCRREVSACLSAVALPAKGEDFGVVDEAVNHGGGDDVVCEDLPPRPERHL